MIADRDRDLLFVEIDSERHRQDQEWGGPSHDDHHGASDWCHYILKQNRLARDTDNPREFESRMVKIAALAIAAIESNRRNIA